MSSERIRNCAQVSDVTKWLNRYNGTMADRYIAFFNRGRSAKTVFAALTETKEGTELYCFNTCVITIASAYYSIVSVNNRKKAVSGANEGFWVTQDKEGDAIVCPRSNFFDAKNDGRELDELELIRRIPSDQSEDRKFWDWYFGEYLGVDVAAIQYSSSEQGLAAVVTARKPKYIDDSKWNYGFK